MERFSSRKKETTKKTKVIWNAKSITILEAVLYDKQSDIRNILKIICDPKAPFIQQEIKKRNGYD